MNQVLSPLEVREAHCRIAPQGAPCIKTIHSTKVAIILDLHQFALLVLTNNHCKPAQVSAPETCVYWKHKAGRSKAGLPFGGIPWQFQSYPHFALYFVRLTVAAGSTSGLIDLNQLLAHCLACLQVHTLLEVNFGWCISCSVCFGWLCSSGAVAATGAQLT